jgi:hypothetical protein
MIMTLKEQVLSIADRLKTVPVDAIIKVMMVFVKPALDHWCAETNKHFAAMNRYPEGSEMRGAHEAKYNAAFINWHRLNFLVQRLADAERFQSFNASRFQKLPPTTATQPAEAQAA